MEKIRAAGVSHIAVSQRHIKPVAAHSSYFSTSGTKSVPNDRVMSTDL